MTDNKSTQNVPIEVQTVDVRKQFGAKVVLSGINVTIREGEIVCIVGGSGSGKTVLLDHLIGLMSPTSGRILVADHNHLVDGRPPLIDIATATSDELDMVRLHWAVVFQRNALFSGTVRDNLSLWLREHTRLSEESIDERIKRAIRAVALDDDTIDKERDALSGGMAKRVAIARAIACEPLVMFYDEPTTGLDPVIAGTVHDLIWRTHSSPPGGRTEDAPGSRPTLVGEEPIVFRELEGLPDIAAARATTQRRTSIIVTHDRDLLRRLRPRIIMLHQSKVCYDGPYDDFGRPDCPPAQAYLAHMPILHERPA